MRNTQRKPRNKTIEKPAPARRRSASKAKRPVTTAPAAPKKVRPKSRRVQAGEEALIRLGWWSGIGESEFIQMVKSRLKEIGVETVMQLFSVHDQKLVELRAVTSQRDQMQRMYSELTRHNRNATHENRENHAVMVTLRSKASERAEYLEQQVERMRASMGRPASIIRRPTGYDGMEAILVHVEQVVSGDLIYSAGRWFEVADSRMRDAGWSIKTDEPEIMDELNPRDMVWICRPGEKRDGLARPTGWTLPGNSPNSLDSDVMLRAEPRR